MNITNKKHKYIDILIEFTEESYRYGIVAITIVDPKNIKKKFKLTSEQKTTYISFLESVKSILKANNFQFKDYQSTKSYAYYFDLQINADELWTVRIRIADHEPKGVMDEDIMVHKNQSEYFIIRHITIGENLEFKSYIQALSALRKICSELAKGDLHVLEKSYRNSKFDDDNL